MVKLVLYCCSFFLIYSGYFLSVGFSPRVVVSFQLRAASCIPLHIFSTMVLWIIKILLDFVLPVWPRPVCP